MQMALAVYRGLRRGERNFVGGGEMKQRFILSHDTARQRALSAVSAAPEGMVVEIKEPTRSLEQSAKLHAMLGDVAAQVEWHGMKLHKDIWKRLCTAAMLRELGESPMLVPSLDGHGVEIIYEKTSTMGVRMMAALIEWVYAFGGEKGVLWSERAVG
jgi:hypothetical protein